MSLLELPQELLDNILDFTLIQGGFENFVLACKEAQRISKKHIERYHELRRTWRTLPSPQNTRTFSAGLGIIEAIVTEPELAYFVETLDLSSMLDLQKDAEDEKWRIEDWKVLERAKEMVMNSPAIKAAGQDPEGWMLAVHDDDDILMRAIAKAADLEEDERCSWRHGRDYDTETQHEFLQVMRTVFLLTLLPNLKELTLPNSFGFITGPYHDQAPAYFLELLHCMARQVHASPKELLPLSRLERLHPFEEIDYQYSPKTGFTELAPFFLLPRMTQMNLRNIIATNEDRDHGCSDEAGLTFEWPYGDMTSNIRHLHLEGCCMDALGIEALLKYTPHLETFHYTHHPKYRGVGVDWWTGDFIASIQDFCWKSLKDLRINSCNNDDHDYWGTATGRLLSLKKFEVLETLRIPISLLRESDGIADLLPASLKRLAFFSGTGGLKECYDGWQHDPPAPSGHWAFKNPEAIRALDLESFVVFVHMGRDENETLESLSEMQQLRDARKAGVRLIEADHEGSREGCSCVEREVE